MRLNEHSPVPTVAPVQMAWLGSGFAAITGGARRELKVGHLLVCTQALHCIKFSFLILPPLS